MSEPTADKKQAVHVPKTELLVNGIPADLVDTVKAGIMEVFPSRETPTRGTQPTNLMVKVFGDHAAIYNVGSLPANLRVEIESFSKGIVYNATGVVLS